MVAAKTAIATSGHNISNANTEGYTRQRVQQGTDVPRPGPGSNAIIGTGVHVKRVERINDDYIEKQLRNSGKEMAHLEEKELVLKQTEDIFNEMGGEGLNRLMARFFNEFRKLANDPNSEAVRQSVREASQAMVNDVKRLRKEIDEVRRHIDNKLEGNAAEINAAAREIRDLNVKIKTMELGGAVANDLRDKRDTALKKLGSYMDLNMYTDKDGNYMVDIKGMGPLVAGSEVESFSVYRSPADENGKVENALDVKTSASASSVVTHRISGGKMGALLEVRDKTLSEIQDKLDDLAYNLTNAVNQVHEQGFTRDGATGVSFFKRLATKERAAEYLDLSDDIKFNINNIAAAGQPDAPGDNRAAIALSGLQGLRIMSGGQSTVDDFYNSIVSEVGVNSARTRSTLNQQRDIQTQLTKVRDQISGVSIDEETANLLQYQHAFDASAKVIQVADEMLRTVLELKRN